VIAIVFEFKHREPSAPVKTATVQTPVRPLPQPKQLQPSELPPVRQTHREPSRAEILRPVPVRETAAFAAEVLVPSEERVAFEKFLAREKAPSAGASAAVVLVPEGPKELVPLPAVEIASLKVLPLNGEEGSQNEF